MFILNYTAVNLNYCLRHTEKSAPGNHGVRFAQRITTDPFKDAGDQTETEGERERDGERKKEKERALQKKTKWKTLACCQGNSKAALLEKFKCDWLTERGAEL